jgi:hypothetical protein
MTPTEIASRILQATDKKTSDLNMFRDAIAKEIAHAISEEREIISQYLNYLSERIATEPKLVRHRLLSGSSRIQDGRFLDELTNDEQTRYTTRLNPIRRKYYTVA